MTRSPYDPFHELEHKLPEVFLCTLRLPAGKAWWLEPDQTIVLDDRLDSIERRCALAHEIEHVRAGDTAVVHVWFATKQEARAHHRAARRLVRLDDLVDALRVTRDEQQLAAILEVDVEVLRLRLDRITDLEQDYVERQIEGVA